MMIYDRIPKRKARKPNAKQRELQAEWEALLKKYEPKKPMGKIKETLNYTLSTPPGRETPRLPSHDTGGFATKRQQHQYTGDKIVGIGTLHKSNAVPVFSQDEAVEMSRMRRG